MKFKVIIIDDEPLSVSLTRSYLEEYREFEVVAECYNGFEGIKAINSFQPDLLFLDIQMPKINGFELLELLEDEIPVIFTTAYDEYALKAFEANALDYLLKPFSKERFNKAVTKFIDKVANKITSATPPASSLQIDYPSDQGSRIVVKSGSDIKIIPAEDVLYIEAYDDYIKVNVKNDCFLKKFTMQKMESALNPAQFIRVHRSYIVNTDHITRLEPAGKDTYLAVLRDNTKIPLSKSGYPKLKAILGI